MQMNELNKKINIYCLKPCTNELEEDDVKPEIFKNNIWASIIPQTGSLQKQQADTILSNVTHKIKVRYETAKDVTDDMFIKYGEQKFEIKYILDPYMKHEFLEIFCEEKRVKR